MLQVLEIPVTDFTTTKQSRDLYLAHPSDATNPFASPLLASDLSGLPPAVVMCAEYDALRDEGMAYAERLALAGVPVKARSWEGQFHGSHAMVKVFPTRPPSTTRSSWPPCAAPTARRSALVSRCR